MSDNQIVVYQPDETIRLDVRLENETVWLTQSQIALLFGTQRPAITKHIANIYMFQNGTHGQLSQNLRQFKKKVPKL